MPPPAVTRPPAAGGAGDAAAVLSRSSVQVPLRFGVPCAMVVTVQAATAVIQIIRVRILPPADSVHSQCPRGIDTQRAAGWRPRRRDDYQEHDRDRAKIRRRIERLHAKENGAVMVVIWNTLILHARWGGMVKERGLMNLAIFGNVVTAWSWFGVNMLGIGLHSYGFMDAAFYALLAFDLLMLALIGIGMLPERYWRSYGKAATPPPGALQPA